MNFRKRELPPENQNLEDKYRGNSKVIIGDKEFQLHVGPIVERKKEVVIQSLLGCDKAPFLELMQKIANETGKIVRADDFNRDGELVIEPQPSE